MKPLRECFGMEWIWTRPKRLLRRFELRAGEDLVASLETTSWLGVRMTGETARGMWSLRHEGFIPGRVTVRSERGETPDVVFSSGWFGAGPVTSAGGSDLRWSRGDFWGRHWIFLDADGHPQLAFARRPSFFRGTTAVFCADAARTREDLDALVLLGYFLIRMLERQSHAS